MSFPEKLRALMQKQSISAYRLAKDIGLSPQSVGYWLAGQKTPDLQSALKLAAYFNTTVEQLMK